MRKFINKIGCSMEFDDNLDEEVIKERLEWAGKGWKEVK